MIVGVLLNLLSTLARSLSWRLTINQALPEPHPSFGQVFSAYGIGLLGNAVLPARAGELARVAVLRRHLPHGKGTSATLLGTVFAHRLFDLFPVAILVVWVLLTAKIPHWAVTSLVIFGLVGIALLAVGLLSARTGEGRIHDGMGSLRALLLMARQGLAVLRRPVPGARRGIFFQCVGWLMQLLAVWAVMEAFDLDLPLPAAGLVLLLMNVAIIFPLWPGNVGLLQAAVALPLGQYGVAYGDRLCVRRSCCRRSRCPSGSASGSIFLAREGLSLASLKTMEEEQESEEDALLAEADEDAVERERHESSGLNEPRRSAMSSSAVAWAGPCPVTAVMKTSRSSATSETSDDGGDGGRPRHVAEERDLAERLTGAERAPEDLDLAPLDHVEAVAGVAFAEDRLPGRRRHDRRRLREELDHVLGQDGEQRDTAQERCARRCGRGTVDRCEAARGEERRGGEDAPAEMSVASAPSKEISRGASSPPTPIAPSRRPSSTPSTRPSMWSGTIRWNRVRAAMSAIEFPIPTTANPISATG